MLQRLENWLWLRLQIRRDRRKEQERRRNHKFKARLYQPSRCGEIMFDDGYSDPDYCNRTKDWHTR